MNLFPQPLSSEEEQQYLLAYQNGDTKARDKLIERNLRLVAHIVKKYQNSDEDVQDLISIGTIGLIKAVTTFDARKGKLGTYAARCIENELLMFFRGRKKISREVSLYEPIGHDKEGNVINLIDVMESEDIDLVEQMELRSSCAQIKTLVRRELTPREQQVIILRYGLGEHEEITQRKIGEMLGISRSYVSRIEKKALEKLRYGFERQEEAKKKIHKK